MSNTSSEILSQEEIGERLRIARETAKVTQATAAAEINVARTTIVAIEQGQRRARLDELQKLAALYGVSVNTLMRREAIHVDLKPRFRKTGEQDSDVESAIDLLTTLVQAETELENLLGAERNRNDLPERPLLPGDVSLQAEQNASELRQWLGLGLAPVHDMISLLGLQLGLRIYVRRLPTKISGLYAFDETAGACILLNASHPASRRAQTAAHELGHFVSTRRAPDALYDGSPEASREERYANTFSRAFLTPARAVMSKFSDITAGATQLTRRHVILLSHTFGVSREAMVRRLEELRLTKNGTWDWFQTNGGITDEHARQVIGDSAVADSAPFDFGEIVPMRLSLLASEAWRRGLLSEGQISQILQIDRLDVRQLLDTYDDEGGVTDASPRLPA
jgi:Zn-dependent peptidase ImmA (M78 family)